MRNTVKPWPPGFVSALVPEPATSRLKGQAASRARTARLATGVQAYGTTNTVADRPSEMKGKT